MKLYRRWHCGDVSIDSGRSGGGVCCSWEDDLAYQKIFQVIVASEILSDAVANSAATP